MGTSLDDDWERGGVTRIDVLEARGYPPEVVAGNGHAHTNGNGNTPAAACEVCGVSIPASRIDRQAKTCDRAECQAEHRHRRDRAAKAARRQRASLTAAPAPVTPAVTAGPVLSRIPERPFEAAVDRLQADPAKPPSQPRGSDLLGAVFQAAMLVGATASARFEVVTGSDTWAITVTRTGGRP
jgi:hypothetical protein